MCLLLRLFCCKLKKNIFNNIYTCTYVCIKKLKQTEYRERDVTIYETFLNWHNDRK